MPKKQGHSNWYFSEHLKKETKPSSEAFHKSFQTNNAMSKANITEESCAKKVSSIVVSGNFSVE